MSPDPTPVIDLIEAFRRSKAMFVAVKFGVFDRAPVTVEALAEELRVNAGALERLLDACVGLGFLVRRGGAYANSPVAETYLRRESPRSLVGYILYSDAALYPMWAHLEDAIREGSHRWAQTFGLEGPIFNHFFRTDADMRTFVAGMHGFGVLASPAIVEQVDLSRFRRMADLGGATGHLAIAACERYPELTAAVFDLPNVVPVAREHIARSPARARLEAIGGDFFADPLPSADLYALGRILHDWSEPKIRRLLEKIAAALPPGGALLVAEKLLADDKAAPTSAHMQSLNMLICTEGKERSLPEYRTLLTEAGFAEVSGYRTGQPVDAILAVKGA